MTVAICAAAADVVLLWPQSAVAQAPSATGSWQVIRQSTPLGALPSTNPPGNHDLPVQNSPAGVLAFSALRYVTGGAAGGTLTLSLSGQQPTNPPAIDLCPVTSAWTTGPDQPWNARPTYDCAHAVVGSGNPSQMNWEIGPGLLRGGHLDVALVPDSADRTPYAVTFAAPGLGSFEPIEGLPTKRRPSGTGTPRPAGPSTATQPSGSNDSVPSIPALGTTSMPSGDSGQAPAVAAPTGTPASSSAPVVSRGPASRTLGAGVLAAFALILLLRSFVSVGSKGRTPRSLIPTPPGEA